MSVDAKAADPLNGQPGQILSEETAQLINDEVKKLVQSAYDHAKSILVENRPILEAMTRSLLDKETISRDDIVKIVKSVKV
jgi:cell division protease FtsH